MNLEDIPKDDLIIELVKREGVDSIVVPNGAKYQYDVYQEGARIPGTCEHMIDFIAHASDKTGPARILVVR
jgi:hypothetical protein